jgi:lipopolysaccharide transport system permease protein
MEYEIRPPKKLSLDLKELYAYRELFYFFTWRDIKVKYKQTSLGIIWALLQPFAMAILMSLFLGKAISQSSALSIPYPLFVLSGLCLWGIFSGGVSNAGNSMITNANIIKKIYFPRLIIPISSILVSLFDALMSFLVLLAFMIYYGIGFNLRAVYLIPSAVLLTGLVCFGVGTYLSALTVKYRDFRFVIPFLIQVILFASPVMYPILKTNHIVLDWLLKLNPMICPINLMRAGIGNSFTFTFSENYLSFLCGLTFLFFGLFYFKKTEHYFADLA